MYNKINPASRSTVLVPIIYLYDGIGYCIYVPILFCLLDFPNFRSYQIKSKMRSQIQYIHGTCNIDLRYM